MVFQTLLPHPLPKLLVIFGLGDWSGYSHETEVTAEVCLSPDKQSQRIGKLSTDCRSLVWEGDWRLDFLMDSRYHTDRTPAKLILTLSGQVIQGLGFSSSTPARKRSAIEPPQSPLSESTIPLLRPSDMPSQDQHQISEFTEPLTTVVNMDKSPPMAKGQAVAFTESEADSCKRWEETRRNRDVRHIIPANRGPRRLQFGIRRSSESGMASVCPSSRWGHALCLSDPETAILIGGEGPNQQPCADSLWKLEIGTWKEHSRQASNSDFHTVEEKLMFPHFNKRKNNYDNDFWFPMEPLSSGPTPESSIGHSATYDPDTKRIYIFGGLKEGKHLSNVYILDTTTWKWTSVTAVGKVPTLAYHSATIFQKELYVFGGTFPSQLSTDTGVCSNLLYIFNPEYKIWYLPIVEGEKPLPRYGHSSTLLRNQLLIFGGWRPPVYLNDLHILDLGFMEYSSIRVPAGLPQPTPRCFHATMAVSDHQVLISGGTCTTGSLGDAFVFNIDTTSWSRITFSSLNGVPRAGHAMLHLNLAKEFSSNKESQGRSNLCRVLVFGGSDGNGNFYRDTAKFELDLREDANNGH